MFSLFFHLPTAVQSFTLGLIATFIYWILRPRTKLVWSKTFNYCHSLNSPPTAGQTQPNTFLVYNEYFVIQNFGRKTAENVEVIFNFSPQNLSIWPQRNYSRDLNPENRFVLSFNTLVSKEYINLSLLEVGREPPALIQVRNPDGIGRQINARVIRVYPKWVYALAYLLFFSGICVWIYGLLRFIYFLIPLIQANQTAI